MSSEPAVISKSRLLMRLLIVFVIGFDVAACLQWMGGAYESEFGVRPDEGAQYVAGRNAGNVIAQSWRFRTGRPDAAIVDGGRDGAGGALERYSVAPGRVWPPGFAAVQAGWYAVFGASRLSALLLLAALAAGVATLLYGALYREFGEWPSIAGGLLWLCASLVRESYGMVMPGMLGALAILGATLAWGRFLDEGRARDAISFGVLAALAVLTEEVEWALGLMAAGSLAVAWRWRRLANWAPWVAAILIVAAGIFVHAPQFPELVSVVRPTTAQAAAFYAVEIASSAGIAVTAFAIAGICFRVFSRGERRGRAVAVLALVLSVFACLCVLPFPLDASHVLAAAAGLILLAVAGAKSIAALMLSRVSDERVRSRREFLWILLPVLLVIPVEIAKFQPKGCEGFGPFARLLLAEVPRGSRILIASNATGEGMFISEIAMNDRGAGLAVETAGDALVEPGKRSEDPRMWRERFRDDARLIDYLSSGRFQYIVLDDALPYKERPSYHDQLRKVIKDNVRTFWPIDRSPISRGGRLFGGPAEIYRVIPAQQSP